MTSGSDDLEGRRAQTLLILLAKTCEYMMAIWQLLYANPAVKLPTQGCDVRRYQPEGEDEAYCFQTYVEAEPHVGDIVSWSLDICQTASGWRLDRNVSKQAEGGAETIVYFERFVFGSFDELARRHAALMTEFVESASDFDFSRWASNG